MPLSWNDIKSRALAFSREWSDAGYERGEAVHFWVDFFDVFGMSKKRSAQFEAQVKKHGGGNGFVDVFWPGQLLVEQKSRGKPLQPAFDQALDYFPGIADRDLPHTLVVCDFARFRVTDVETGQTIEFGLADLHKHIRRFGFIAGYRAQRIEPQNPVNAKAAQRMGRLHDALKASGYLGHPLEVLLVRLLFCLFADDTGIFQPAQSFRALIEDRTAPDGSDTGSRLAQLFQILNTPDGSGGEGNAVNQRSRALDEQLAAFPYVNGRLFDEAMPMADFTPVMRDALLDACALDWSAISPAIFGALFQSIMDAKARRNLGAHYTSEENILKVIKSLFLDSLWAEFGKVRGNPKRLLEFHGRLRTLTWFDPACGCGNFLVISYRELRLLELEILRASRDAGGQRLVDVNLLVTVNVDQFYGIEIEEFPAQIARVAMWLVDHQMNLLLSEEFGAYFARIPLRAAPQIAHGNALRLEWNDVLPASRCTYLLGNPPFVGAKFLDDAQRDDTRVVFSSVANGGLLDFVAAWYVKGAGYMQKAVADGVPLEATPCCAFVSTNSIMQGEQVGVLWGWLLAQGVRIHFAHRTFSWSNEASGKAAVHCVIVGFGLQHAVEKKLFLYDDIRGEAHPVGARNINPYLVDAPDVLLPRRSKPICDVPEIGIGSQPIDDGNYLFTPSERVSFLEKEPSAEPYFHRWIGSEEFINSLERWTLWLGNCTPQMLRSMPHAKERVELVRRFRAKSKRKQTLAAALRPTHYATELIPRGPYLVLPKVSSERRRFVPIGFELPTTFCSDLVFMLPNASRYHFGILSSTMHNAWIRTVCGRLKSDYRYSAAIVYNNFPWPELPVVAEINDQPTSQPANQPTSQPANQPTSQPANQPTSQPANQPTSFGLE